MGDPRSSGDRSGAVTPKIKLRLVEVDAQNDSFERADTDGDSPYRQFVNVPGTIIKTLEPGKKPAHGRYIRLRAEITFDGDAAGKATLKGHTVLFAATRINQRERKGLSNSQKEGFKKPNGAMTYKIKTIANGWTDTVQFHLSTYAGDEFEITASVEGKEDSSQKLGPYVVWRKVWFQKTYMKGIGADGTKYWDLSLVQEHFNPVFVQLEIAGQKEIKEISYLWEYNHIGKNYGKKFILPSCENYKELLTHLLFVDQIFNGKEYAAYKVFPNIKFGEDRTYIEQISDELLAEANGVPILKEAFYIGEKRKKEKVDAGWFSEFKQESPDPDKQEWQLTVKLKREKSKEHAYNIHIYKITRSAGIAFGHDIYIALGQWKKNYSDLATCKAKVLGTIIHEFGHQLGMVPKEGEKFIQEGGPHCTDEKCVMYKEQRVNKDRPLDFCPDCKNSLLEMKFEKLTAVKKV